MQEATGLATFDVLQNPQNLSSTIYHVKPTFCRTFLQNPKCSAECWVGGGSPDQSFKDRLVFLKHTKNRSGKLPDNLYPLN